MRIGTTIISHLSKLWNAKLMFSILCYIFGEAAGGNVKLITHGNERVKLSFFPMGRYLIGGGGGSGQLGLKRGGSSIKFWSNGRGTRLLNL